MTLAKKTPKRQTKKSDFSVNQKDRLFNYDDGKRGDAVKKDRAVNIQNAHGKLKAVVDVLDSFDYDSHELPPHVRIAKLQRRIVRLQRSLVAQVVVKARLRRELKQMKGGQDEPSNNCD